MKSNPLLALTAAAATLPALNSHADQVADQFQFGYRYHSYEEDPIPSDNFVGATDERYDIDVNQFRLVAPVSENTEVSFDYQKEKMSGASPWYTIDLGGTITQVMSGASIYDERTDASIKVKSVFDRHSVSFTAAVSDEDDYDSQSFAVGYSLESADGQSTYSISADVSNDDIYPVDADIFFTRPQQEQSKRSQSVLLSYSRVINKALLAKFSVGHSRKKGYLSDPYKVVFVDFALLGDNRPESRHATTLAGQLRYFSDSLNGAFHADYRYYEDNWDIKSHTFDFAWYQNLGWGIQLVPSIRLYDQTAADFYEPYYYESRSDGLYSTDYRLSEYGAITYSLKLEKQFEQWSVSAEAQSYKSGGSTGLANADIENPALIDFELLTFGVNFVF